VNGTSVEAIGESIRVRRGAPRIGCCEARFGCVVHSSRQQKRSLGRIVPALRNMILQANLGLAMLLLLTACSPERRWVSVPNGKAGEFIDVSSIATAGLVRRASIKIVFTTPQSGDASQGNRRVVEIVVRQAFDCAENTQKTEAMTFHYANGVVFEVPADQLPSHDWKPVEPDDGKPELDFTCRQQTDQSTISKWF
jgi:hypothetical protein